MLSLPDFKEKQILFIQPEWGKECKLRFYNENIVFSKDDETLNRASCHKVFAVFILGDIAITTNLIRKLASYGISVFFLKSNFETCASVRSQAEGNYLLRMKQYAMSEAAALEAAKKIVHNKIRNQLRLLKNAKDDDPEAQAIYGQINATTNHKTLLGIEGQYSKRFFNEYFAPIGWLRRAPRIKEDVPNFLMDIGYSFLFNFTDSLLRLHGFDTFKGVYHRLFFQRRSLACDMIEPFRCIVDKQILKSYNLKQVNEKDFTLTNGKFLLPFDKSKKYSEIFLQTLMDNKENLFNYVHGFYRFIMDEKENPFPVFKINS